MTNNYKPFIGGVPISIERLAKGLVKMGHEVTIFAPTYSEEAFANEWEDTGGIEVFRYASLMQRFVGGVVLPNPLDPRIEAEFRKHSYDIIHVHHPVMIGRTAVYLSKKYHIPLTFTYHTRYEQYLCYVKGIRRLEEGASREGNILGGMEKRMLFGIQDKLVPLWLNTFIKHCQLIIAPTKGIKDYLVDTCGYDDHKVAILPTGIEKAHFEVREERKADIRARYHAGNMPFFLTVSRLAREKNVSFLLRSVAAFKELYHRPFRFVIVGDGPNRMEYETLCQTLHLEEEVIFAGKIRNEDIAPYYAAADAFLFASKTETQGIVILEAFAGATPVIAVDASGVRDLVKNNINGYLCPEEEEELAEKILSFISDESLKMKLSEAARMEALEFCEDSVAGYAVQLYNNVIAEYHLGNKKHGGFLYPRVVD